MPNIALIAGNLVSDSGLDSSTINAQNYSRKHSARDFPNGTLIETTIDYSVTNGDPFVLEITGNSYGALVPFNMAYQGYIYNNTTINHGGISIGAAITGMSLFNYNGKLCFWFPSQAYWQGFNVYVYIADTGYRENKVTNITNVAKPAGITKEISMTFQHVIRAASASVGTTNYVPKFTGNITLGDSQIFDNGTSVGIGTAAPDPTRKLDVSGTARITGRLFLDEFESANLYGIRGRFTNEYIQLYSKVGVGNPNGWGEGQTSTPQFGLSVYGGLVSGYGNNANAIFYGNVGIGTTTPADRLDVSGNVYVGTPGTDASIFLRGYNSGLTRLSTNAGSSANYNGFLISVNSSQVNSLPTWNFDFGGFDRFNYVQDAFSIWRTPSGGTKTNLLTVLGGGNVGIGLTAPNTRFSVLVPFASNGDVGTLVSGQTGATTVASINTVVESTTTGATAMTFSTLTANSSVSEKVRITNAGNVGIGTTTPSARLDVFTTSTNGIDLRNAPTTLGDQTSKNSPRLRLVSSRYEGGNVDAPFSLQNVRTGSPTNDQRLAITNFGDVEVMSITNIGDVGIGIQSMLWATTNRRVLEINGTSDALIGLNVNGAKAGYIWQNGNDLTIAAENAGFVQFGTNGTALRMRIDASGNVGIGAAPLNRLHVEFSSSTAYTPSNTLTASPIAYFYNSSSADAAVASTIRLDAGNLTGNNATSISAVRTGNADSALTFGTRSGGGTVTERVRITSTGNLGIGTTSPTLENNVAITEFTVTKSGNVPANVAAINLQGDRTLDGTSISRIGTISFWQTSNLIARINALRGGADNSGALDFLTNSAGGGLLSRLYIHPNGRVGINTTSDVGYQLDVNGGTRVTGRLTITGNDTLAQSMTRAGTSAFASEIYNSGGDNSWLLWGVESSLGGVIFPGSTAYAAVIGQFRNTPLEFFTNNTIRGSFSAAGAFRVNNLAGTGSRIVVADANGVLSTTDTAPVTGTGTAGYITRWTGTSTQGVSQIFDNGTRIGIGTVSPAARLDIRGTGVQDLYLISTTGSNQENTIQSYFNNGGGWSDLSTKSQNLLFYTGPSGGPTVERLRITSGGDVGIGLVPQGQSGFKTLEVGGTGVSGLIDIYQGTTRQLRLYNSGPDTYLANVASGGSMLFRTTTSGGTQNNNIIIFANGRVGINTTTDAGYLLDVNGDVRFSGTLFTRPGTNTGIVMANTSAIRNTGTQYFDYGTGGSGEFYFRGGSGFANVLTLMNGGNVGVNTASPVIPFQLNNYGGIDGNGNQFIIRNNIYYNNTNARSEPIKTGFQTMIEMNNNDGTMRFSTSSASNTVGTAASITERVRIFSNGRVFIGASPTDAGYQLDVNGTLRSVNGANFATTSGNVGIGTTSPLGRFETISATGKVGLNVGVSSSPERGNLYYDTDGTGWKFNIGKYQGSTFTPQMTFQDNGNIGIGTTSAAQRLDVSGVIRANSGTIYAQASGTESSGYQLNAITIGYDATAAIGWITAGGAAARTNLVLQQSGGEVLIGTASDAGDYKLQVNGNLLTNLIYTRNNTDALVFGTNAAVNPYVQGTSGNALALGTSNNPRILITSDGNVGIGTTSPVSRLQVQGAQQDAAQTIIRFAANNASSQIKALDLQINAGSNLAVFNTAYAGSAMGIDFADAGTSRMRITSIGNVGIGTTDPIHRFVVSNAGAEGIEINPVGSLIQSYNRSTSVYNTLVTRASVYNMQIDTTMALYIDAARNVGIGVTPSAWGSNTGGPVLEFANGGHIFGSATSFMQIGANTFYNGSNYLYKTTSFASRYLQSEGQHMWYTAPSGNAGTVATLTERMRIFNNGRVFIGSSPVDAGYTLDVNGPLRTTAGADLATTSGNVNIGTAASSSNKLVVFDNKSGTASASNLPHVVLLSGGTDRDVSLQFSDGSNTSRIGQSSGGVMYFASGSTERMRLTSGGSVLIGPGSDVGPDYKLQVYGYTYQTGMAQINGTTSYPSLYISNHNVIGNNENSALVIEANLNTTGAPSMILARITNTASNTETNFLRFLMGTTTVFRVTRQGDIETAAPTGGSVKKWKLGEAATVSPTSPNRTIRVEIDGTVYYLHAKTTND